MPAAGDQQAEVDSRPGDPLGRVLRTERPPGPGRSGELEAELLGRRLHTVRVVPEVAGTHAERHEVGDPVGALAHDAERVGDVLPVAEQLHHPGRRENPGRQRVDQPGHHLVGRYRGQRLVRRHARGPPPVEQRLGRIGEVVGAAEPGGDVVDRCESFSHERVV